MKISFLCRHGSESQKKLFTGAIEGLAQFGVKGELAHNKIIGRDCDAVACWGWRKGKYLKAAGHNVLVFERGYLGDRFHWTSLGWNGLNGRADFCLPKDLTSERFDSNFSMKPWNRDGKNIVIMGQVRGDASLQGKDLSSFYRALAKGLSSYHKRPVYFRPHPVSVGRGHILKIDGAKDIEGDLDTILSDAYLIAAFNSNSVVDAVISGAPALSFDVGCMAYNVSGHKVNERIMPDRKKWAARLAHCQWTPEEIKTAAWWPRLKVKIDG